MSHIPQRPAVADKSAPVSKPARPLPAWNVVAWIARLLVAALFLYAAWGKLETPKAQADFIDEIRQYHLLPIIASNAIAYIVPWLEAFAAVWLITGPWRRDARIVIALMLVAFLVMKTIVLSQGRHIHCGCVPETSYLIKLFEGWGGWAGVLTNVVLLALLGLDHILSRRAAQKTDLSRANPVHS